MLIFLNIEDLNLIYGEVVYSDKNINFIDTSIYFVFIRVVILMIPLLIFGIYIINFTSTK